MILPINDEIIKEKYTNSQKSSHTLSLVSNEQVIHRYLFLDNSAMLAVGFLPIIAPILFSYNLPQRMKMYRNGKI